MANERKEQKTGMSHPAFTPWKPLYRCLACVDLTSYFHDRLSPGVYTQVVDGNECTQHRGDGQGNVHRAGHPRQFDEQGWSVLESRGATG